jgi:hypothetical protein
MAAAAAAAAAGTKAAVCWDAAAAGWDFEVDHIDVHQGRGTVSTAKELEAGAALCSLPQLQQQQQHGSQQQPQHSSCHNTAISSSCKCSFSCCMLVSIAA